MKPKTLEKGATGRRKNQTTPAKIQNSGREAQKKQFDEEYKAKCCTSKLKDENRKQDLMEKARRLANSQPMEMRGHTVVDSPSMKAIIQKHSEPVCGACLSGNCQLRQKISRKLGMADLQTSNGCKGSPKLKFIDLLAVEDQATDTSQPTAAARAVAALLDDLGDEEANQTDGAAKLGVNMVSVSLANVIDPAEELT